ncbi:transcriptional regulator, TetR family [Methylocella silvestris BL2]|uniref:Transcriptional regulator, TetR family n=1 Tax=Methylocella silvestris (strain DSM 15510 / CIP 108128 / LMG 27833 / NCIMB 13906 / BL2) TaxID=395965 RepID=B8ESA7_METSB|nr:TetR/AcrR family transcriptional regulator [Methylocella silvestris]ACK52322.1 transcriptional regulator, TetR family [Methylocella silvestris BL2]
MKVAKAKPDKIAGRRSGRPTKEQAQQLTEHIIDVATRLFLETGFEATSVDLIAETARISKQTFYARFVSKEVLFAAVILKRISDLFVPLSQLGRLGPIETTLVQIGVELSKRALTPAAIELERLIASEAHQFRQLSLAYHESSVHTRDLVADLFSNAMREGQIRSTDARFLAEQFLYAVVDGPARALMLSGKGVRSERERRERIVAAVRLFLDGCR